MRKEVATLNLAISQLSPFSTLTGCTNPKVKSSTYSTENEYFSAESVFIAQVEVDCDGEVYIHTPVVVLYPWNKLYLIL